MEALFHFSVTGEAAYLLDSQRPVMDVQDEDGDTSVEQTLKHESEFKSFFLVVESVKFFFFNKSICS